jgi:hypothetical protein
VLVTWIIRRHYRTPIDLQAVHVKQ